MQQKSIFEKLLARNGTLLILQIVATLVCLTFALKLWRTDLEIPFNYQGDTIYQLVLVKSIASGGWIWNIDHLGAPFGFQSLNFPQNLTFSSLLINFDHF